MDIQKAVLHRVGDKADWERQDPSTWNLWQRIAARTHGIVTPGNVVTVVSLVAGAISNVELAKGNDKRAAIAGGLSMLGDFFDGAVAHATGTKSPLGAKLDPIKDKILLATMLPTLAKREFVSKEYATASLVLNGVIAATNTIKHIRDGAEQTSVLGKLKTNAEFVYIGAAMVNRAFDMPQPYATIAERGEDVARWSSIGLAGLATVNYVHDVAKTAA